MRKERTAEELQDLDEGNKLKAGKDFFEHLADVLNYEYKMGYEDGYKAALVTK